MSKTGNANPRPDADRPREAGGEDPRLDSPRTAKRRRRRRPPLQRALLTLLLILGGLVILVYGYLLITA